MVIPYNGQFLLYLVSANQTINPNDFLNEIFFKAQLYQSI